MPEIAFFDHYEVFTKEDGSLYELGRGAMGVTYKAVDTRLRIPVALKVINAQYLNSDIARQRFVREARAAARLRHRNVASVFHLGSEGDVWFYAMEFIDGETLEAYILRNGPLSPRMALNITAQVARALNAAAQHGLVHRDIKPLNLMLVREDDELVAKVIDFGLAKVAVPDGENAATLSMGGFVGTYTFASPEQLEEKELDGRSDIYSLGVTLWYMLAGKVPFMGSMVQVMSQHLSKPPPFEKLENVPPSVEAILRKMLEKDRANRFQSALELRMKIESCVGEISDEPAVQVSMQSDETLAFVLDDANFRAGDTQFEAGAVLSKHYRLTSPLGETPVCRRFRATDTRSQSDVSVLVLRPEFVRDPLAVSVLEREVAKTKALDAKHPNLTEIFAFETVDQASFLVMEWLNGFSLLELLRARRVLDFGEVLSLLRQAAAATDHALAFDLSELAFDLRDVFIQFKEPQDKNALLDSPIHTWPPFDLKLFSLAKALEPGAGHTWTGGQTVVGIPTPVEKVMDIRSRYIQSLASMVYELLGGARAPGERAGLAQPGLQRYVPISTLSEEGNDVLRRALDPIRSFASAREFTDALAAVAGSQARRAEPRRSVAKRTSQPPSAAPAPILKSTEPAPVARKEAPTKAPAPQTSPASAPASSRKWLNRVLLGVIVASTLVAAGAVVRQNIKRRSGNGGVTSGSTQEMEAGLQLWTAAGSSAGDKAAAVKSFQEAARKGDPKGNLALGECYLLGIGVPARDEKLALERFREAAKTDLQAMNRLGDCLAHGIGGKTDYTEAAALFMKASQAGNLEALANLGTLYLNGQGSSADPQQAAKLFEQGANKGNARCQSLLARCVEGGFGITKDIERAQSLYIQAAAAGDKFASAWCRKRNLHVDSKQ